jgi:hypothetical protein
MAGKVYLEGKDIQFVKICVYENFTAALRDLCVMRMKVLPFSLEGDS